MKDTWLDKLMLAGPNGRMGMAAMAGAAFLLFYWLFLVFKHRRPFGLYAGAAIILGVSGYLLYDVQHIRLNLSMRDSQQIRNDCEQLLELRRKTTEHDMPVSGAAIPVSFTRIGVSYAWVTANKVHICLENDGYRGDGGAWGFLYDPNQSYREEGSPDEVRPTWYDGFYEFTRYAE